MNRTSVFLVDDHGIFTEALQVLLETRPQYVVVGRSDSCLEALEQIRECCPDIVILDLSMPDMNGIEATRRLRSEFEDIRIIALTMHKEEAFAAHFFAAGGAGYLVKDTDAQCLFTALEAVQKGEQFISPTLSEQQIRRYLNSRRRSLPGLSKREKKVLKLIAEGRSRKEISEILNISLRTVDTHRTNIRTKLGCKNTAELVRYAVRKELVDYI
ncbi:MAG: response regulator transcription factor [Deltaproteobacteria bacterium]|nr:response regulator transcription factor [Deltaproteobacteria bacterium]MBW2069824.1 response regulator transcription factor [Deltaproteobacteria bacterium]